MAPERSLAPERSVKISKLAPRNCVKTTKNRVIYLRCSTGTKKINFTWYRHRHRHPALAPKNWNRHRHLGIYLEQSIKSEIVHLFYLVGWRRNRHLTWHRQRFTRKSLALAAAPIFSNLPAPVPAPAPAPASRHRILPGTGTRYRHQKPKPTPVPRGRLLTSIMQERLGCTRLPHSLGAPCRDRASSLRLRSYLSFNFSLFLFLSYLVLFFSFHFLSFSYLFFSCPFFFFFFLSFILFSLFVFVFFIFWKKRRLPIRNLIKKPHLLKVEVGIFSDKNVFCKTAKWGNFSYYKLTMIEVPNFQNIFYDHPSVRQ